MKLLFPILFIFLFIAEASAESRYITDEWLVPLRKAPCGRCAILIGGLKTGTKLTLLEERTPQDENEPWSKVETSNGTVGWMPSQYLETEQVARYRLKTLRAQMEALREENLSLQEQIQQAGTSKDALAADLEELTTSKRTLTEELNQIKQISSDAVAIHNQNQELLRRNKMLQSEVDVLSASNERLRSRNSQTWFLYGGILVALSAILATLLPRLKRRKRFSEWG